MNNKWLRFSLVVAVVMLCSLAAVTSGADLFPALDRSVLEEVAKEQVDSVQTTGETQRPGNKQETAEIPKNIAEEVEDYGNGSGAESDSNKMAEEAAVQESVDEPKAAADNDETADDEISRAADLKRAIHKTVSWYRANRNLPGQEFWEAYTALWGAGQNLNDPGIWETGQYWRNEGPGNLEPNHAGNEHIRYGFILLSVKQDPTNVWGGRNLLAELAAQQQENGSFGQLGRHIWAMELLNIGTELGLDLGSWADQRARQRAVNWLLNEQNENGSFGSFSELDYTGWALITLSYSRDYDGVGEATRKALDYLEKRQREDPGTAGFSGGEWFDYNANSQAAVISGLVALGEDLLSENSRWVQNGETLLDAQLKFQHADGFFQWTKEDPGSIDMATSQSLIALLDILHGEYTRHRMAGELLFN